MTPAAVFLKDPDSVLDYTVDWSSWLPTGDTIDSATVTPEAGITVDSDSDDGTAVTFWLSGGTAGSDYLVTTQVVTDQGRTDDRTIRIKVVER